jgi:three-Cys-motif partner protein
MPRLVGPWAREKLRFLSQYLPVYLTATQGATERIYVDGFAGPGRNEIERTGEIIDGSPLIALSAQGRNGRGFDRIFFIERDADVAAELRGVVDRHVLGRRAAVLLGDVNIELPKLIRTLSPKSPTFVFLDTQSIEPGWRTIEAIAPWRTELFINFPFGMAINRNPGPKVTRYFGTSDWEPIWYSNRPGRTKELLDLYKSRLGGLGYRFFMEHDPLITATGGQRLYYLVFATKVKPGQDIMRWVQNQPDVFGQMSLWPEEPPA